MHRAISVDVAAASCVFIYHPFMDPVAATCFTLYILWSTFARMYANDLMIKINTQRHYFDFLFDVLSNDFIEFVLIL